MLSSERATLYFSRSGKSDLFCPFMGFLKLQQQTAMIFNVRNVIGTLSYVTVIPATMSFYWPLTTSVGKAFGINRPIGNKELNSFSQKEWQNEEKRNVLLHSRFNTHEWNVSWAVIKDFWQDWISSCVEILIIILCTNKKRLQFHLYVMTFYILYSFSPWLYLLNQ